MQSYTRTYPFIEIRKVVLLIPAIDLNPINELALLPYVKSIAHAVKAKL